MGELIPRIFDFDEPATWIIDEADIFGRARLAHCSACGFEWVRPEVDHEADTLTLAALTHNRNRHPEMWKH